ncbi:MAG: hypothetical protein AB7K36_21995, partial [Chloroflexota bacterium]
LSATAQAAPAAAPADDLRVTQNRLAEEHVYLAGAAIAAALGGRQDEFKIAAKYADENGQEIGKGIGAVYGPEAEAKFLSLWRAHIGFFVDYAMGAAAKDEAKKQQAKRDLDGYRQDIDALLTGANPNLPKGSVAKVFEAHAALLTGAIDALAAGDADKGYSLLHDAAHQTQDIADALSGAIVKQFPDKFAGAPMSPAADLRVAQNRLSLEHVYLSGYALNAAIAGRQDEFKVAAKYADINGQEIAKGIEGVYGAEASQKFLALWRAHIGFFADYAMAAVAKDEAKKQQALNDLTGYRQDLDDLLTGANPNLPKGAVAQVFVPHVEHLTGAIDALAAGDVDKGYMMLHEAGHQTQEIADALAGAIAKQFPDKFPMGASQPAAARPSAPAAAAPAPAAKPAASAPSAQAPAAQPTMQMPSALPRAGEAAPPIFPAAAAALLGLALLGGGVLVTRARR